MTNSLFIDRKGLAALVAPLGLSASGFETLPGAPAAIVLSPRRRRWRRAQVESFLSRLETGQ